ncbi:hypothetical protein B0H19DRAFT_1238855 [Mycena capillaripes]|nr:hypothetical protein B0H19DRAFT_1238855 [Mycena capillaripes]
MPPQPTPTHIRLIDIKTCLTVTLDTVEILATSLKTPFLGAIAKTTQSLLKNIQSETASELPPNVLNYIGRSTETLHKIHAFIEAQQSGSKVKNFLRQGEMNALLKDCKTRLQQELDFFQAKKIGLIGDIRKMREDSEKGHQDVLNMIESLSDTTSSDVASTLQLNPHATI